MSQETKVALWLTSLFLIGVFIGIVGKMEGVL